MLCFFIDGLLILVVFNVKSFNGVSAKGFENVDTSLVDEDRVKNLRNVISNGVESFGQKEA